MNEFDIIEIIKKNIGNRYIGDDCAYLRDLGIVITQDSLVEDVHFKREWYSPFQLGYKSIAVNISDVLASGANPRYVTIALSLPNNLDNSFVDEFYKGAKSALYGAEIVGGDITGAKDKIMISVSAIGSDKNRNISSRANAKSGYIVITKGYHGSSAAGLNKLINGGDNTELIKAHIEPVLEYDYSKTIAETVKEPYAMMDTSDGLADTLFKIAEASGVKIVADYNKIRHIQGVTKEQVLFGGEDYKLVSVIPKKYSDIIKNSDIIGYVTEFDDVRLDISGQEFKNYNELDVYNHFGEHNV